MPEYLVTNPSASITKMAAIAGTIRTTVPAKSAAMVAGGHAQEQRRSGRPPGRRPSRSRRAGRCRPRPSRGPGPAGVSCPVTASPLATFRCSHAISGFQDESGIEPVLDCGRPQRLDGRDPPDQHRERQAGRTASRRGRPPRRQARRGRGRPIAHGDSAPAALPVRRARTARPVLGFQKWRTITPATMLDDRRRRCRPARTRRSSTRRTGRRRTCPPMTRSGGQTASVSRQPVMVRTSQNGISSERNGRIRPEVALRRLDVQPGHRAQGPDRRADRPPGHGRGVGDQAEQGRLERLEPQPDQERRRDRHRRTEPGRPLDERPERERHQDRLEPAVAREPGDRRLHHLELAGRHGDVVEEDRRHDQPDDPERRRRRPPPPRWPAIIRAGIPKTNQATSAGRDQPGQGRPAGIDPARGQEPQEHQHRQRGRQRSRAASFPAGRSAASTRPVVSAADRQTRRGRHDDREHASAPGRSGRLQRYATGGPRIVPSGRPRSSGRDPDCGAGGDDLGGVVLTECTERG